MAGLLSWAAVLASLIYTSLVIKSIYAKYGIVLYTYHPVAGCLMLVFATLGVVSAQRPRKEKGKHKVGATCFLPKTSHGCLCGQCRSITNRCQ